MTQSWLVEKLFGRAATACSQTMTTPRGPGLVMAAQYAMRFQLHRELRHDP